MHPVVRKLRLFTLGTCALTLTALVTLAACSDDSSGGGTTDVNYQGTFASAVSAGKLAFGGSVATVRTPMAAAEANAVATITGTMTFLSGTVVNLTGTLDGTALALTGGGYTFAGTQSGTQINGTFTGPDGETGIFTATLSTTDATVKVLCGEYTEDAVLAGYFNLALAPDRTGGVVVVPGDGSGGQLGKARPKSGTTDQVEVLPNALPNFVIATGTLTNNGNDIAGTWDDGQGSSGTFAGSVAGCSPS
jgi:hypothetical protein